MIVTHMKSYQYHLICKEYYKINIITVVQGSVGLASLNLGVIALNFCFTSSVHNFYLSSGSLFFAHLGVILFIAHYLYL